MITDQHYTQKEPGVIPLSNMKQLQEEIEMHKRSLAFMEEENILLKNRVSEVLKNGFNENMLNEMEVFHGQFVREDELIRILKSYILEADKLLLREVFNDGKIIKDVKRKLQRVRTKMETTQRRFTRLKSDFNSFLSENS
jgi:hypothetical protein